MLARLGKISADDILKYISYFSIKQDLRQFARKIKACFLGKTRKNGINVASAELAQRVVEVK